jgi:hypothetical protein
MLGPTKNRLFRYLVRQGWNPLIDDHLDSS